MFDFGVMADSYNSWYETPLGRTYDVLEKKAVARALATGSNGEHLLDVGCGTGHWSAFFSRRAFVVTGVDISPEMVEVARKKGIANASFEVADAHSLPFEDGRFDVAAAIATLEFVRDPEVVVREMARCTRRPGGAILVGVLNALAPVNRLRKAAGKSPYDGAQLLSPRELKEMLTPYGEVKVASTTFVPLSAALLRLAPLTDAIGRLFRLPHGAFVIGRVKL